MHWHNELRKRLSKDKFIHGNAIADLAQSLFLDEVADRNERIEKELKSGHWENVDGLMEIIKRYD